jgi:hypothetical protein
MIYTIVVNAKREPVGVLRSDGWSIPFDPANTDYQEYLAWIAGGNTPQPAEVQQPSGGND